MAHDYRPELGPDHGEFREGVIGRQTHAFPNSRRLLPPGLLEEPADANGGSVVHVRPVSRRVGQRAWPRASYCLFRFAASAELPAALVFVVFADASPDCAETRGHDRRRPKIGRLRSDLIACLSLSISRENRIGLILDAFLSLANDLQLHKIA